MSRGLCLRLSSQSGEQPPHRHRMFSLQQSVSSRSGESEGELQGGRETQLWIRLQSLNANTFEVLLALKDSLCAAACNDSL